MTATISLRTYVLIIVEKVEKAGELGDRAEAARLLRLLSDVALEQAATLQ